MMPVAALESEQKLTLALQGMKQALAILDELDAPGEIGGSLDLAIARLQALLSKGSETRSSAQLLYEQLERELGLDRAAEETPPNPWQLAPGC